MTFGHIQILHVSQATNFSAYPRSTEFEVKVGVHQGSVLSPLLFVSVMEVVTRGIKEGLPWELLYADDLVLVAQSKEELRERVLQWKECMELKGLKVNIKKTVK